MASRLPCLGRGANNYRKSLIPFSEHNSKVLKMSFGLSAVTTFKIFCDAKEKLSIEHTTVKKMHP